MKILILANNDVGLYKFRKELLQELISREYEVNICLPNGDYVNTMKEMGCKFIECTLLDRHGKNPLQDLKLLHYYKLIIKQIKPDIVFTYTIKPNVYGGMACADLKVPYVANITGLGTAVENPGFLQKITIALYRYGLRSAQKVFFQNSENRDFMISHHVVKGAYDLLPGSGVNIEQYHVLDYPEGDIVNFVFISRIMKEKGIDQYLEAAKTITKKYPNTRFHICGFCEAEYKGQLDELIKNGTVTYHGLVSDMMGIYKIDSCTVHPTYYPEGMSNVLLESCACGRPIITTDRSGCREIVDDGVNGFVVKQQDSKDLIVKIVKFLNLSTDARKAMGIAGRAKVELEFDRKIVIQKYMGEIKTFKEK